MTLSIATLAFSLQFHRVLAAPSGSWEGEGLSSVLCLMPTAILIRAVPLHRRASVYLSREAVVAFQDRVMGAAGSSPGVPGARLRMV